MMLGVVLLATAGILGVHAAAGAAGADRSSVEQRAEQEFDKADTDHDTQLNKNEFVTWWSKQAKVPEDSGDIIDFHKPKDPSGNDIPGEFRDSVKKTETITLGFWTAFVNSVAMIIVTELGDKTFFIAAILAMRHNQGVIFSGAISALAIMTVLSAGIGFALPSVMPRKYTHWAATGLFFYFGVKLLNEVREMHAKGEGAGVSEELGEVEEMLKDKNEDDVEADKQATQAKKGNSAIFWQALTLTFLAEWGDRSQIATIALAAAKDPFGVTAGGIIGHSLCTGLAVVGGRILASRISERQVLLAGGILFIMFGIHAVYTGP